MKKIMIAALAALTLGSCFKDKSDDASQAVPTVALMNGGSTLVYEFGQQVEYQPELAFQNGLKLDGFTPADYNDYDYWWRMTRTTNALNDTTRTTVSTGRTLDMFIDMTPTAAGKSYNMALYMRNKRTGMEHAIFWPVRITTQYGAGLVVAHSRDGGAHSDLALIKSSCYNTEMWNGFEQKPDVVLQDIYSTWNGAPIEGEVTSMAYTGTSDYSEFTAVVEGKSALRMNVSSMKLIEHDDQLFYNKPAAWNPQTVFSQPYNQYQVTFMINDGKLHFYRAADMTGKFSTAVLADDNYDIAPGICVPVQINNRLCNGLVWDKRGGAILTTHVSTHETPMVGATKLGDFEGKITDPTKFDPGALGAFDCLFAGYINSAANPDMAVYWNYEPDHRSAWLLREKSSGGMWVYELETSEASQWMDYEVNGTAKYDMSGCEGLAEATCWATSRDYHEFFYAVGGKIYCAVLDKPQPTATVRFEAAAGEVITHLDMNACRSGRTYWSMNGSNPAPQMSHNNLMTVVTWNGSEGKVYALPRQHAGTGEFAAPKFWRSWGGFGRITAINVRE